jgi:Ca2+-binding EF-hand superfamily protein
LSRGKRAADKNTVTGNEKEGNKMIRIASVVFMLILTMTMSVSARQKPLDVIFQADDTDGNGLVSEAEWHAAAQKRFELLDTNKDGNISKEEMDAGKETLKDRFKSFRSGE